MDRVSPIRPDPTDQSADNETDHDLHRQRGAVPRSKHSSSAALGHRIVINTNGKFETERVSVFWGAQAASLFILTACKDGRD